MMRPAEAVLEILRSEGVDRIFGNPGTTELPLLDALASAPDLPYTLGLHEGSVVAMADGYARATRRTSVVSIHIAAGVANGLLGMLNASRSRTPMVLIAGQQDRRHLVADPMLSGDLVGLARPATKSAVDVAHAADLPLILRRAFALAIRPPAGPVLVSVPMDLLEEAVDLDVAPRSAASFGPGVADGIVAAGDVLAGARAPAIIAGDGVGRADALAELVEVAEVLGAAVYHQPMYDRVDFPQSHPLAAGTPLPTTESIRAHLEAHDAVLIVGTHAFMAHHYTSGGPIPDGTAVVQLDEDAAEVSRNFPVAVGLVGGLALSLRALAASLVGRVPDADGRTAAIARQTAAARAAVDAEVAGRSDGPPLDPLRVAAAIAQALPPDATVVEEAITMGMHLRRVLRRDRAGAYVHTVGGALGWGIGAAVGTRLGDPDRPVVAVLGDGCAMFGLQGLWTAAHERVPVTFLVMDNGEYRTLKDTTDRRHGGPAGPGGYLGLDLRDPAIDWAAAGQAFGIETRRVERLDVLCDVIRAAGERDAPLLVDVPISPHDEGVRR